MSTRIALIGLVIAATALAACSSSEGSAATEDGTSTTAAVDAASDDAADPSTEANVLAAEALIDAFYSYDSDRLAAVLATAPDALPEIGYYQGWAEGANYEVLERSCEPSGSLLVICPITVEDDFLLALGSDFKVTDTFTVYVENGVISNVTTSSDDPDYSVNAYSKMYNQAELRAEGGPCEGFFDGGPTPGECARAWVEGYKQYAIDTPSG